MSPAIDIMATAGFVALALTATMELGNRITIGSRRKRRQGPGR